MVTLTRNNRLDIKLALAPLGTYAMIDEPCFADGHLVDFFKLELAISDCLLENDNKGYNKALVELRSLVRQYACVDYLHSRMEKENIDDEINELDLKDMIFSSFEKTQEARKNNNSYKDDEFRNGIRKLDALFDEIGLYSINFEERLKSFMWMYNFNNEERKEKRAAQQAKRLKAEERKKKRAEAAKKNKKTKTKKTKTSKK